MSQTVIKNISAQTVIKMTVPITSGLFASLYKSYHNTRPEYDSDESAILDGLTTGDIYKTAQNHVTAPGGILIELP